jgi:hypothetical protein
MRKFVRMIAALVLLPSGIAYAQPLGGGGSDGASCASSFVDGCLGAPVAAVRLPTILNGYAARPPWKVAGVDYAVGVPAGVILKDPEAVGVIPNGATINTRNHTITVMGDNVTLDSFDFGLHNGYTVIVQAAGTTVKNSHFLVGINARPLGTVLNSNTSCRDLTLLNSEFDGANIAVSPQQGTTIGIFCSGTFTVQYNYFHNSGGDMIDINNSTTAEVDVIRYNLFKDIGVNTGHEDTIQWFNSTIGSGSLVRFNTVYQTVNKPGPGNGLLVELSEGPAATMTGLDSSNNTVISLAACSTCNWGVGFYAALGGVADHVSVRQNFIDATGINLFTASPWFGNGQTPAAAASNLAHPMAMHDLTNMVSGAKVPVPSFSSPSPLGYYVYPDLSGYTPSLSDIFAIVPSPASGDITTGNTITLTLDMVRATWTVAGTPTISLSNGGTAYYSSGSGSNSLVFTYTVGAGQTATNLAVTSINLAGGTINDSVGNASNLSGPLTTFAGLNVN